MSRRQLSAIGIDAGPAAISAVQVSLAGGGRPRMEAAAIVERSDTQGQGGPPSGDEARRLADVLYRQGFEGRRIVLSVPDSVLLTALLELPPRDSGAPLDQLARMELARIHRRDPGTLEVTCWDVPAPARAGDASHVMAAACDHSDAAAILDPFEEAGLWVIALDVRAWAMARACPGAAAAPGADPALSVLLDVDEAGAILAVVRSGVVVYDRLMPDAGVQTIRSRLCKELGLEREVASFILRLGVSPAAAGSGAQMVPAGAGPIFEEYVQNLAGELRSALDFAAHRYPAPVDRICMMGPGASVPGLAAALGSGLELPVSAVSPAEVAEIPANLQEVCRNPGLATALGLALWTAGKEAA